jgi:hypothetical protein
LQGAQGDVNSCVVHKPEREALLALDVIASRYARAVRLGIREAKPVEVDSISSAQHFVQFTRKDLTLTDLSDALAKEESVLHAPGADPESYEVRMAAVCAIAVRKRIASLQAGESTSPLVELQGLRIGPISLLGSPLEIFQAIKNDVKSSAQTAVPLVIGLTNGAVGYAPDKTAAARGGYASDMAPLIIGGFPFKEIHSELVRELLRLENLLL